MGIREELYCLTRSAWIRRICFFSEAFIICLVGNIAFSDSHPIMAAFVTAIGVVVVLGN